MPILKPEWRDQESGPSSASGAPARGKTSLAENRKLAVLLSGLVGFLVSMAVSLLVRFPLAHVPDEFCYLLNADTFAHGRLTNPTPVMWRHFESIHLIQQPSYASKYPPGQGLILALGQVLTGYPIVGVWLCTGLACAALCWMLFAWMPARWALLGGLLASLHPVMLKWSQCYWGGGLAVIGGALLFGGFRRLADQPRARDAWIMGLGIAILANSRPYEGVAVTLICLGALAIQWIKQRQISFAVILRRVGGPICGMLALTALWLGTYNHAVTGSPLRMPYQVHESTYSWVPLMKWQPLRKEPPFRHASIRNLHLTELTFYKEGRTPRAFVMECSYKLSVMFKTGIQLFDLYIYYNDAAFAVSPWLGSFRFILVIALLALPGLLERDPWMTFCLRACGLFAVWVLLEVYLNPPYLAPMAGIFAVILLQCLREVHDRWRLRDRPIGRGIVRVLVAGFILSFFACCWQLSRPEWGFWAREPVISQLDKVPGDHLVVVHYGPDHIPGIEWVYNSANIDQQRIIWSREMSKSEDRELLNYYPKRKAWILDADAEPPKLRPYTSTSF